jgi:tetratricopeptide (TPR) repeat protein
MMDFEALKSAKKKVVVIQEKQTDSFDSLYNEGIKYFNQCIENENIDLLKKAADKFVESIHYKSTMVEPYFYLAHIFYVLGKDDLTIEYLKIAQSINPDYPRLQAFKKIVFSQKTEHRKENQSASEGQVLKVDIKTEKELVLSKNLIDNISKASHQLKQGTPKVMASAFTSNIRKFIR